MLGVGGVQYKINPFFGRMSAEIFIGIQLVTLEEVGEILFNHYFSSKQFNSKIWLCSISFYKIDRKRER